MKSGLANDAAIPLRSEGTCHRRSKNRRAIRVLGAKPEILIARALGELAVRAAQHEIAVPIPKLIAAAWSDPGEIARGRDCARRASL